MAKAAGEEVNPAALALRTQLAELARIGGDSPNARRWEDLAGSRVILPSTSIPWGVAHFLGGAVLGQFPELCYDALLRPLADRAGIAVVCTPYELAYDHYNLARAARAAFEAALAAGAERYGWSLERMPRLALGHSLGAKLQVMLRCNAEGAGEEPAPPALAVGLLAFNNFGIEDQVRLLRETLRAVQNGGVAGPPGSPGSAADRLWETLLEPVIGRAAKLTGVGVRPDPEDLLQLVRGKYDGAGRTRVFRFDGDALDCSEELLEALVERGATGVDNAVLRGGHLTPVLVSMDAVTEAAATGVAGKMADRLSERFLGAGFQLGSEADLELLLRELTDWVRGGR